ncbi:MAG TPA: nicotinate-nucleotide adenylyltransferase [Candidatus Acidoferrum sp.]|nr:nicotinate-nucleotide adenylyltransferase [Candidatus Acidoferrum sp.]
MSVADADPVATTTLRRFGVLGGMFDPIHLGHVQAANSVGQALGLEKVLLVPCGSPVHRQQPLASAPERCAMAALAIKGQPLLQLEKRECQSPSPSYTIDTIIALQHQHAGVSWHLLIGVDAFVTFTSWKQWQQLLDLVNLVVMTRPGYRLDVSTLPPELRTEWQQRHVDAGQLATIARGAIAFIDVQSDDLSSTRVRELVRTGGDLAAILNPDVAVHIRTHGLYLPGDAD